MDRRKKVVFKAVNLQRGKKAEEYYSSNRTRFRKAIEIEYHQEYEKEPCFDNLTRSELESLSQKQFKELVDKNIYEATQKRGFVEFIIEMEYLFDVAIERTEKVISEKSDMLKEINKLKKENLILKSEIKTCREELEVAQKSQPTSVLEDESVEELISTVVRSMDDMICARIAAIEKRPQTVLLRPQLQIDQKKCASVQRATTEVAVDFLIEDVLSPSSIANLSTQRVKDACEVVSKKFEKNTCTVTAVADDVPAPIVAEDSIELLEEAWETVTKKGKRTTPPAVPAVSSEPKPPKLREDPKQTALKLTHAHAIMVTLKPEAVAKGVTYTYALGRAMKEFSLEALGVTDRLRLRERTAIAATGARVYQFSTQHTVETVDILVHKIKAVLDGLADIVRI